MTAPSSRELEFEAEAHRARVAETLEEIRSRFTAGQMFDRALDYARANGGTEFLRNLGQQVKTSPIPVALMATGLAWLMMAPRSVPSASAPSPSIVPGSDAFSSAYDTAAGTVGRASSTLGDTADRLSRQAQEAVDKAAEAGRSTLDKARHARDSAAEQVARTQNAVSGLLHEQPLIVGAIGIALGALLGAALPKTKTEDELVGKASDAVKDGARAAIQEQVDQAKAFGRKAIETAQEETGGSPSGEQKSAAGGPSGDTDAASAGQATRDPFAERRDGPSAFQHFEGSEQVKSGSPAG